MDQQAQALAAFEKIISHGRTAEIRKSAQAYWTAYTSDQGADETTGTNFEKAIRNIPIDYRQPTLKPLEELNDCKQDGNDDSACYLNLAISLVDRIIKLA